MSGKTEFRDNGEGCGTWIIIILLLMILHRLGGC